MNSRASHARPGWQRGISLLLGKTMLATIHPEGKSAPRSSRWWPATASEPVRDWRLSFDLLQRRHCVVKALSSRATRLPSRPSDGTKISILSETPSFESKQGDCDE